MKNITGVSWIHTLTAHFFEVYFSIVPCCCHCFPSAFSVPWFLSSFPHATVFFLPAFLPLWEGLCVWPMSCCLIFNILLFSRVLKHVLASLTMCQFCCWCCLGFSAFVFHFFKFWQHHASVSFSLLWAWNLPVFVCI